MKRNKNKIVRAVTVSMSCIFFHELMSKMRDKGYEMVALSSPGSELDEIRKEGFHTIEIPMERHISLTKDLKSLLQLIKVFRKEKPEIVHSMTPKAGLLCMVAAWLTRVPVRIHTFTGLVWPTAHGLQRKILMVTDKITCACATHIIPEGKGVMNDLRNGHITKKPMKVLGYGNVKGVDMERFKGSPHHSPKGEGGFTFLFVGRIVGDKGLNELVSAFTRLYNEFPFIRLSLVGAYEPELDPLHKETEEVIKSNDAIITLGAKYGDDLIAEYSNADCFVMPSYREGFPNTVLEAGAMGLPCIVTDINGSREIIENDKNGFVVPSKDAEALYLAMRQILTDEKARKEMAANARPMIASRFDKNFVQQYQIDFYQEILNHK